MNGTDTTNAKAAANSIVPLYDPSRPMARPSGRSARARTVARCTAAPATSIGTANAPADLRRWIPVGLSGTGSMFSTTYRTGHRGHQLLHELEHGHGPRRPGHDGGLRADPQRPTGRPEGHHPRDRRPAERGSRRRAELLRPGECRGDRREEREPTIEIFTIGFGLDAASGGDPACPDTSGTWRARRRRPCWRAWPPRRSSAPPTCDDTENNDGDHFYCIGKTGASTDLTGIFKAAAAQLAKGNSRLVQLYPVPGPVQRQPGAAASHLGGTSVTITGLVFHRRHVGQVRWAPARRFTVTSDTTITATAPAGTDGQRRWTSRSTTPGGTIDDRRRRTSFTYN